MGRIRTAHRVIGGRGGLADPSSLSGLKLWLDSDTGSVSSWTDLSGNGNHAVQAVAGLQPTISTNVANGHRGYVFDGSNDIMVSTFVQAQPCTVYLAYKLTQQSNVQAHDMVYEGSPAAMLFTVANDPLMRQNAGTPLDYVVATPDNAFYLATQVWNTTNGRMRVSKAQVAAGNNGSNGITSFAIGGQSASTRCVAATFLSLLVYAGAHITSDLNAVEGYLAARFGL